MRTFSYSSLGLWGLLASVSGCSPATVTATASAANGAQAFALCDLRTASQDFANAHDLDPSRPDFTLAYALSTLAVLAEDPAVTSVLGRLGFDGPIDTSMLWGTGGILEQLSARSATCQSISDYARAKLPYRAAQMNGPSAASVVRDPSLTINDFVNAAVAISPRIEKVVDALTQAAEAGAGANITGGCGVGTVYIQSPELFGLAAFLEACVAAIKVAQGYDWGIPVTLALDTSGHEKEYVDALNAHFFHVENAASIEDARPIAENAVLLMDKGILAVSTVNSRPHNSLFNWADAPPNVLADLHTLAEGTQTILATSGLGAIPFVSPALTIGGRSFFDDPLDVTGATPPVWSVGTSTDFSGGTQSFVTSTSDGVTHLLTPRFAPYPFAADSPGYSWMLSMRWQNVSTETWNEVFDPDTRWENTFGCSNGRPALAPCGRGGASSRRPPGVPLYALDVFASRASAA